MTTTIPNNAKPISSILNAIGWDDTPSAAEPVNDNDTAGTISRPWILCIDDDQEFSHGLKLTLQSRGYDVVRAFAGMDGYRLAFEIEPVAILLDLHLPNGNGEEILSQLCFHPTTAHIPVAIVTGMREQGLEQRMISQGARAFFNKPIPMHTLVEQVDRFRQERGQ